ncbi:uncharacterized protein LOC126967594 [Leptidea sinapis]|uniref:uncharacterized protein LOC126967594 n=1 Tax=Leptidea sinapis TaxID=189913 RepID=UPI00212A9355|nr:uncharacterized protein LOC126967594 [Leptidea sinapis]
MHHKLLYLTISTLALVSSSHFEALDRGRRQLLFTNITVMQVNAGVGTPSTAKNINVNWLFQANFALPWNRTQIPIDILNANSGYIGEARKKRNLDMEGYENDAKLYHFYKYVENFLNGFRHNGTSCVLKTLCQLGAEPIHTYVEDDILHEIAAFVLNPENDIAETNVEEAKPYVEACNNGRKHRDCSAMYNCSISLIDMFTKIQD